jgi:hypothetical protein
VHNVRTLTVCQLCYFGISSSLPPPPPLCPPASASPSLFIISVFVYLCVMDRQTLCRSTGQVKNTLVSRQTRCCAYVHVLSAGSSTSLHQKENILYSYDNNNNNNNNNLIETARLKQLDSISQCMSCLSGCFLLPNLSLFSVPLRNPGLYASFLL